MKVFVAGATGVLGRRAVPALVAAGHAVRAAARDDEKSAGLRSRGADPVAVDLFDGAAVRAAVDGSDAVVNLATHIPAVTRAALPGAWKVNDRLRREASAHLVDAALATGAERYVQESIVFGYPDCGDRWIDEDVEWEPTVVVASAVDAETEAARFSAEGGIGVVLRFAMFQAPDATPAAVLASALLGAADAYLPIVHADDAGAAVPAALGVPAGIYNVTDDEPLTRAGYLAARAAAGGRRLPHPPGAPGRLGGPRIDTLLRSQRVSNRRLRAASDWRPRFPSARETLADLFTSRSPT